MLTLFDDVKIEEKEIFGLVGPVDSGRTTIIQNINKKNKNITSYIYKLTRFNFKIKTILGKNYNHEFVKELSLNVNKRVNDLNYTEIQKVIFFKSIFTDKPVILLDEPFLLIEESLKQIMIEIIKKLNKTVIISFDNVYEAENVCNKYALIKDYKVISVINNNNKFNAFNVIIKAKDIDKKNLPLKNMKIKSFNHDEMEFVYKGDINELIKFLADIKLNSLIIRNSTLEELYKYFHLKG